MTEIAKDLLQRIDGRLVIASVSGGKDSAAMCLHLKELGIPYRAVFMDTGWEHYETYRYLSEVLPPVIGEITWLQAPLRMVDLILKKGMFPSRQRRFCTQELKVFPMQAYLRSLDEDNINAVGIRKAESKVRSQMAEWEWSDGFDCEVWRPIIDWSEDEVIAIHKRHGLPPNPLYLKGASRVGCWPCIYARKKEIHLIAETDPARIAEIRELERRVAIEAEARYWRDLPGRIAQYEAQLAAWIAEHGDVAVVHEEYVDENSGETETLSHERPEPPGPFHPPAWFQAPMGGDGACWPIDEVVEWSKTSRGGRQYELFAPDFGAEGCMRWGLCDTAEVLS